jgi:hypothetical protein
MTDVGEGEVEAVVTCRRRETRRVGDVRRPSFEYQTTVEAFAGTHAS